MDLKGLNDNKHYSELLPKLQHSNLFTSESSNKSSI